MPIQYCKVNGKTGYRWGRKGKCYSSRAKALRQARAIESSKRRTDNVAKQPGNPRTDPTRTGMLRRAFFNALKKRFRKLRFEIMDLVDREDVFGLREGPNQTMFLYASVRNSGPTANQRWRFNTTANKVKAFQQWLKQRLQELIHSEEAKSVWQRYVEEGLRKGAARAFDDTRKAESLKAAREEKLDFYQGTKQEFLRSAFAQPVAVEKVQLLAGRVFDELEGITTQMSTTISRTLTDGLVQGKGPREVARELAKNVDISEARALTMSRTELIRAHADGQLEALEQLGVEEVGVAVEWSTSGLGVTKKGYPSPCALCAPLKGVVLTLEEAKGKIPYHPG